MVNVVQSSVLYVHHKSQKKFIINLKLIIISIHFEIFDLYIIPIHSVDISICMLQIYEIVDPFNPPTLPPSRRLVSCSARRRVRFCASVDCDVNSAAFVLTYSFEHKAPTTMPTRQRSLVRRRKRTSDPSDPSESETEGNVTDDTQAPKERATSKRAVSSSDTAAEASGDDGTPILPSKNEAKAANSLGSPPPSLVHTLTAKVSNLSRVVSDTSTELVRAVTDPEVSDTYTDTSYASSVLFWAIVYALLAPLLTIRFFYRTIFFVWTIMSEVRSRVVGLISPNASFLWRRFLLYVVYILQIALFAGAVRTFPVIDICRGLLGELSEMGGVSNPQWLNSPFFDNEEFHRRSYADFSQSEFGRMLFRADNDFVRQWSPVVFTQIISLIFYSVLMEVTFLVLTASFWVKAYNYAKQFQEQGMVHNSDQHKLCALSSSTLLDLMEIEVFDFLIATSMLGLYAFKISTVMLPKASPLKLLGRAAFDAVAMQYFIHGTLQVLNMYFALPFWAQQFPTGKGLVETYSRLVVSGYDPMMIKESPFDIFSTTGLIVSAIVGVDAMYCMLKGHRLVDKVFGMKNRVAWRLPAWALYFVASAVIFAIIVATAVLTALKAKVDCPVINDLEFKPTVDYPSGRLDVIFALDESGSIGHSDFIIEKTYAQALMESFRENGKVEFGVVLFNHGTRVIASRHDKKVQLEHVDQQPGGTNIGAALQRSSELFRYSEAKKVIVLLTDGCDGGSSIPSAITALNRQNVRVFIVAVGPFVCTNELERIVASQNVNQKDCRLLYSALNFQSLVRTLREIAHGIIDC